VSDPKLIGIANAGRRARRRRRLAAFGFLAVLGIGIAVYVWSSLRSIPGTVYALDGRTGNVAWRISSHEDYLELSWHERRLVLRATGGSCDSRYSDYFVINRRTHHADVLSNYLDSNEVVTPGAVSFGGRSYETELPDDWAHAHYKVQAVRLVSGTRQVLWSARRPVGMQPVAVDARIVLIAPPDSTSPQPDGPKSLEALDRRTGRLLWRRSLAAFGTRGAIYANYPQPQLSDGIVFAYLGPSHMGALDGATGRLLWRAPVAPAREMAVGPNLVAALGGGTVTALTRQGHLLWSHRLEGRDPEPGDAVLAIDKHMVYVAVEGRAPFSTCSPS
jgi:outer membrane protein assembly factor BamB